MKFVETWRRRVNKKYRVIYKRGPSTVALVFAGMALAAWGIFALLSSYPVFAYAYYTVRPATTALLAKSLSETVHKTETVKASATPNPSPQIIPVIPKDNLPEKDISLPEGHYLSIPKIGVDTVLWEGKYEDYEKVLKHGVWRVPDFGSSAETLVKADKRPMILAAHRFGYLEWSQDYRVQNSFYNLPKLKVGDTIEVMWDQRRYKYVVEKTDEGTTIKDYSGDLILYTCKFLVSPVRYFVYAKLVL